MTNLVGYILLLVFLLEGTSASEYESVFNETTEAPTLTTSPTASPQNMLRTTSPSVGFKSEAPTTSPITNSPTTSPYTTISPTISLSTKSPSNTPSFTIPTNSPSVAPTPSNVPTTVSPSYLPTPITTFPPSTRRPSLLPTTYFPSKKTKKPKTKKPTGTPSEFPTEYRSPCNAQPLMENPDLCNLEPGCSWLEMQTCIYAPGGVLESCKSFTYQCQERATFCSFEGTLYDKKYQCNNRGRPCAFDNKNGECFFATLSPTVPPVPRWDCFDTCMFAIGNGRCDDGGEGADSHFCFIGTDCSDCGPRLI